MMAASRILGLFGELVVTVLINERTVTARDNECLIEKHFLRLNRECSSNA